MLKRYAAGLALCIWSAVNPVYSATLTVDGISGKFVNTVSENRAYGALTGTGTNSLAWGTPWTAADTKSSYTFSGSPTSSSQAGSFLIGSYTHKNGVIAGRSDALHATDLNVSVAGRAGSIAYSLLSAFSLTHNETMNYSGCPAAMQPCGDFVTIANKQQGSITIQDGASIYQLIIDGFVQALGGPIINGFYTSENQAKTLYLQASLVLRTIPTPTPNIPVTPPPPPAPVPLPAGGWALASALAAFGVLRRRRKA